MQLLLRFVVVLLSCTTTTTTEQHNITRILAEHQEFSKFNQYLTVTNLAAKINKLKSITVCAVGRTRMDDLKCLPIHAIKKVLFLSLHILLGYYNYKLLHYIKHDAYSSSPKLQATGSAPGSSRSYVKIMHAHLNKLKVGFFLPADQGIHGTCPASPQESEEINNILPPSPGAEDPTPSPQENEMIISVTSLTFA